MLEKIRTWLSWAILTSTLLISEPSYWKQTIQQPMWETRNRVERVMSNDNIMSEWKTNILWEEYDFTNFRNKVLKPLSEFEKDFKIDLSEENIFKFWIIENMWTKWDLNVELKSALKKLSWDNYKSLMSQTSHVWAKWIFQIMEWTRISINQRFKVEERFKQKYQTIKKKYKLDDNDMLILKHALYCWLIYHDLTTFWKWSTEKERFWMYNMWPNYLKITRNWWKLNAETTWYIQKYEHVNNVVF